jgi:hypothetical protein
VAAPVEEAQGEVVGGVEAVGSNGLTESVNAMRVINRSLVIVAAVTHGLSRPGTAARARTAPQRRPALRAAAPS